MKELLGDKYVLESQGNDAANANIKGNLTHSQVPG
jgi:hypothetical protein